MGRVTRPARDPAADAQRRSLVARIVLLPALRQRAIHAHHLSYYGRHFGLAKTFARLALRYWWPRQRANVRRILARCTFCMANIQFSKPWRWLGLPIGPPFEIVAAGIFGPLNPTVRGQTHILVLIDHHTRWVKLVALPEPTAELVANAIFEYWTSRCGTMRALLTDNGSQFTACSNSRISTGSSTSTVRLTTSEATPSWSPICSP